MRSAKILQDLVPPPLPPKKFNAFCARNINFDKITNKPELFNYGPLGENKFKGVDTVHRSSRNKMTKQQTIDRNNECIVCGKDEAGLCQCRGRMTG